MHGIHISGMEYRIEHYYGITQVVQAVMLDHAIMISCVLLFVCFVWITKASSLAWLLNL